MFSAANAFHPVLQFLLASARSLFPQDFSSLIPTVLEFRDETDEWMLFGKAEHCMREVKWYF